MLHDDYCLRKDYLDYIFKYFDEDNSGKISKTTLTNLMMQLRKCCNHPYLFLKNYDDICYN